MTLLVLSASPGLARHYSSLVMDAETGRVLHAVNADTRNYPASLTKMMTLYQVFAALEKGELRLDQELTASARAARQPSSRLGLEKGDKITVEQAILALVTKSANDVATVIAEALAGSEREFALRMTATARELGMSQTVFRNASGLPNRAQKSTARDMATLARHLIKDFPKRYHYFATESFTYHGIEHKNHNRLLTTYDGTDGIKTGYIRASGFNLVASATRGGHRLIGVVFGERSPRARNRRMTRLLDRGFNNLATPVIAEKETEAATPQSTAAPPTVTAAVAPVQAAPAAGEAPKPVKRWGIQVGAYHYHAPAYKLAANVVAKFPDLLEDGIIKVAPLKYRKRRAIYRARILGLSKHQAYQACRVLKKRNMDCMEMRLHDVQLAALQG